MIKSIILAVTLNCLLIVLASGQSNNLILNPSFEEYNYCPETPGSVAVLNVIELIS